MKRVRSIHVRKFALEAQVAASRFLSRTAAAHGVAAGWRAVPLFWHRKHNVGGMSRPARHLLSRTVWAPELHLHFSLTSGAPVGTHSAPTKVGTHTTFPVRSRSVIDRHGTTIRFVSSPPVFHRSYRSTQDPYRFEHGKRLQVPVAHPQNATKTLADRISRESHVFQEHWSKKVLSQMERIRSVKTLALHTAEHRHHTRELRYRTGTNRDAVLQRSWRSPSQQQNGVRPAQLVWRREPKPPSSTVQDAPEIATSTIMPSGTRFPNTPPSLTHDQPVVAASQIHQATLDAGFMDRLTDDVIRRVERRVRIERERRGL